MGRLPVDVGMRGKAVSRAGPAGRAIHLTGKESLLDAVKAVTDVVKVTSKGQITLPVGMRAALGIRDDSYLMVERVGDFILLKKAELRMREIQKILRNEAKRKNITRKALVRGLERERRKAWGD